MSSIIYESSTVTISNDSNTSEFRIDGSSGESGGQMGRLMTWLSLLFKYSISNDKNDNVLSGKDSVIVTMTNYRASRPKPGLAQQHLIGISNAMNIINAQPLQPLSLGLQDFSFQLSQSNNNQEIVPAEIDCCTAGSISLLIQSILPTLLVHNNNTGIILKGGTDVGFSPPIDYTRYVLLPIVNNSFSAVIEGNFFISINKRGVYPKGGGDILFQYNRNVDSLSFDSPKEVCCSPIHITDRGDIDRIIVYGWNVKFSNKSTVIRIIKEILSSQGSDEAIGTKRRNERRGPWVEFELEDRVNCRDNKACGILLVAITTTGCRIASDIRKTTQGNERNRENVSLEPIAMVEICARQLLSQWNRGGCFDEHGEDQIIPFMILHTYKTRHSCTILLGNTITQHTYTCIDIFQAAASIINVNINILPNNNRLYILETSWKT